MDERVLLKQLDKALQTGQKRSIEVDVMNTARAFGTILGSEITRKFGDTLEEDTFRVLCNGAGGQSFGAFIPKGLTLELVGDSNDYFGKGLSGGKLIVYPPKGSTFKQDENIIIGNVALYGATSVRHSSMVWPVNVSVYVTPVQSLLWKVWAIMAVNT